MAPSTPPRWPLLVLFVIALGGAIPRLANLGTNPPALHPDEAASAADASEFFSGPAVFYAHERGGWVEATYVAAAALPVRVARSQGWSVEAAARLPASLAGCLLILAVAWAGRELTRSWQVALGAALCLALQPWAWHFSHLALRGTLTPLFVAAGIASWLRGERAERPLPWALFGGASLALAALTYPPLRLQAPLIGLLLYASGPGAGSSQAEGRGVLLARRLALAVTLLGALALIPWTLSGRGSERLGAVLAWDPELGLLNNLGLLGKGYLRHFGTRFLFSGSSSRGFAPEGVGLLPRWQGILLVLGILACLARRRRSDWLILGLVVLFPLAAAPTRDVPNAMRAVLGILALALLAGRGWQTFAFVLREGRREGTRGLVIMACLSACMAIAAGGSAAYKARLYFVRYPDREANFYYPGRREIVERAAALAAEGQASRCDLPFLEASIRLYAPRLPARRVGEGWILGAGEPQRLLELSPKGRVRERRLR